MGASDVGGDERCGDASAAGRIDDPSVHYFVPGVPLTKPDLVAAIRARGLRSVAAVFRALAGGKEDEASTPGLAALLRTLWGAAYEGRRELGQPSAHAVAAPTRASKTCVQREPGGAGVRRSAARGIGIEARFDTRSGAEADAARWAVHVGGGGSIAREADLVVSARSRDEARTFMGRFMQYYRANAKHLERTFDFVQRVGIAKVRAVVVADGEAPAA